MNKVEEHHLEESEEAKNVSLLYRTVNIFGYNVKYWQILAVVVLIALAYYYNAFNYICPKETHKLSSNAAAIVQPMSETMLHTPEIVRQFLSYN